nr:tyrosine kinase receptor Cad96Ca-like [Pocillopora verrucosa]
MACQIAFKFGCSSANTVNTRCGSVVLDFMMRFNRSVVVSNLLTVLFDAAMEDKFGGFKVDPESIKQVFIPTDGSESTTKGPEECNCPSNNVSLAINGVLAFIIVLLIIYIIWLHKKGAVGKQRTYEDKRGVSYNETGLEDSEPSLLDSAKLTQPPAEYMDLIEVNKHDRKAQSTASGADYVPLHPLTRCWEVPRYHVTIEKIIGKGAFGQVAKGTAVGLRGSPETTTVAIKMLKKNATESDKRDLMKELDTMKQLKPHPYVIKLLGCVTESEQLLVLIEYVPFGDLLGYLRKSRGLKDTYFQDPDVKPQTNLTSQQLMKFAWQIADGMSYLSSKSIIHRDLAARNVLVGHKETCKVTDFGMARDVQQENIYERKTKGRLPVKWTAYEALMYGKYTTKSDVWSYGVLLYEIFTIGGSPYPRMDGRKIANLLQDGYRMPKPQHVNEELYQIMMKCWKNDPDARPTFTELKNQLTDMETLHKKLINMTMYDKQLYANVEDLIV